MTPEKAVEAAYLHSMLESERGSLPGNLLVLIGALTAASFLVSPLHVLAIGTMRCAAIMLVHRWSTQVRDLIRAERDHSSAVRGMVCAIGMSGASWGSLFTLVPTDATGTMPALLILAAIVGGFTLITIMVAAHTAAMHAFIGGFAIVVGALALFGDAGISLPVAGFGATYVIGLHNFSRRSAIETRNSARIRVENRLLADRLAHALRRQSELASTDSLTGLANRRGFEIHAQAVRSAAGQPVDGFHLLVIDLDHFKRINDKAGHAIGDSVLRATGRLLGGFRDDHGLFAQAARLGGEEFALLVPTGPDMDIALFAEQLRLGIAQLGDDDWGPDVVISASIGQARWNGEDDIYAVLAVADRAMYRAKREGRDRFCLAA